jgi:hypothetical protein
MVREGIQGRTRRSTITVSRRAPFMAFADNGATHPLVLVFVDGGVGGW